MFGETSTPMRVSVSPRHRTNPDPRYPEDDTPVAKRLGIGRELGPYRLLEWLGRGGQGDVWKAHTTRALRGTRGAQDLEAVPGA